MGRPVDEGETPLPIRNGTPNFGNQVPPTNLEGPQPRRLTAEEREWAMAEFSEEEFIAGMRDIQENGGYSLEDLLLELEEVAKGDE